MVEEFHLPFLWISLAGLLPSSLVASTSWHALVIIVQFQALESCIADLLIEDLARADLRSTPELYKKQEAPGSPIPGYISFGLSSTDSDFYCRSPATSNEKQTSCRASKPRLQADREKYHSMFPINMIYKMSWEKVPTVLYGKEPVLRASKFLCLC